LSREGSWPVNNHKVKDLYVLEQAEHTGNEGPVRIQYKFPDPINVFLEMKLCQPRYFENIGLAVLFLGINKSDFRYSAGSSGSHGTYVWAQEIFESFTFFFGY
jgi:hypothetical protein